MRDRQSEALVQFRQAAAVSPSAAGAGLAQFNAGFLLFKRRRFREAEPAFRAAAAAAPADAEARHLLATALANRAEREEMPPSVARGLLRESLDAAEESVRLQLLQGGNGNGNGKGKGDQRKRKAPSAAALVKFIKSRLSSR